MHAYIAWMGESSPLDDLDLVRTFLVVAQERSLTRAAARLFRTQSALSRRLQQLEQALGQALFVRRKVGVVLTDAGSQLLEPARELLKARDRLLTRGATGSIRARLRIACSDTVARYLLAPRLPALLDAWPDLELELQVSNTPQTIARVAEGDADLGFVLLPARHKGLEFRPVLTYHHMAAFPPGRAPRGKEVGLATVLEQPLVLLDRSTRTRQLIDASLLSKGLFPGRVTEVGNVSVQKALVRAGLGVGILPGYAREAADGLGWRGIQGSSERVLAACLGTATENAKPLRDLLDNFPSVGC
jgi:DNA-binding transcriptional LysR family regulator